MKRIFKFIGKILLSILILFAVFLIIMTIYNQIMLKKEDELLKNYPGELVEVDGHNMNVLVEGEGEHTLVFLAPAGDTAPMLTFEPLYTKLSSECRTVVIEKFGYGMSDLVDNERNYEVMVEECREALEKSGVEAPYILCPYSKSGLDTLIWSQKYPDEVEAIISLDMAFPGAFEKEYVGEPHDNSMLMSAVRGMGILRLFVSDSVFPETFSKDDKEFARALFCRKFGNKTFVNEINTAPDAAELINSQPKPECMIYLFLSNGDGTGIDNQVWQGFAHNYTNGMNVVSVTDLDCNHNKIIDEEADQIINKMKEFIAELDG